MATPNPFLNSNDTTNGLLPAPLAYARSNDLFTGDIRDLRNGERIESALKEACEEGNVEAVKKILETNHIGVNAKLREASLLVYAVKSKGTPSTLDELRIAWNNQARLVKFLLREPSIHISEEEGVTALYSALSVDRSKPYGTPDFNFANYEMAFALIQAGANINHVEQFMDREGLKNGDITLLMRAWEQGPKALVIRLILSGANIERSEQYHNTYHMLRLQGFLERERSLASGETPENRRCREEEIERKLAAAKQNEQRQQEKIVWSKQYLHGYLNDSKFLGIECARLWHGKDTGFMRLSSFLVESKSLGERAFTVGYNMMRQRLVVRLAKPVFAQLPKLNTTPASMPLRRTPPPPL